MTGSDGVTCLINPFTGKVIETPVRGCPVHVGRVLLTANPALTDEYCVFVIYGDDGESDSGNRGATSGRVSSIRGSLIWRCVKGRCVCWGLMGGYCLWGLTVGM